MCKKIVFSEIVKPILSFFVKKSIEKGDKFFNRILEERFEGKFLESLEEDVLKKYGNEVFYNDISKLIFVNNIIEKIYIRCYQIESSDFRTDDQLIKEIISNKELSIYDESCTMDAFKYILDKTFYILNCPEFSDSRRILNYILLSRNQIFVKIDDLNKSLISEFNNIKKDLSKINNIEEKVNKIEQLVDMKELPLASNPILNFSKDNQEEYSIEFKITSNKPLFKAILTVKYAGTISRFPTAQQYLAYLSHTGKKDSLDVVSFKIKNNLNELIFDYSKEYYGPVCQIVEFDVYALDSFPNIDDIRGSDMKIVINPPLDSLVVNIENENGDVLVERLEQGIMREYLPNGDLKVSMIDTRKDFDVSINLTNIIRSKNIINTTISLVSNKDESVRGRLTYYGLLEKFSVSKKLILRNSQTGKYSGEFCGIKSILSIEDIRQRIEFYKKIQKIQDTFYTLFKLPNNFDYDDIQAVDHMYDLAVCGQAQIDSCSFSIKKSDDTEFIKTSKENRVMIYAQFNYIIMFEQKINLDKASIILPLVCIKEENDKECVLETIIPSLIIWGVKYGDYDPCELASDFLIIYKEK